MFQFPSNTRLCEAIHILLVIKLLLGVNYHHHAPRCYSTDLDQRSILLPIHYKIRVLTNTVAGIAIFLTPKLLI